ncbi:MAG: hypothetical protein KF690_01940 [Bacteroidetes bacterium]|nr:hypothetical protein [Bacteroidota bacterium]
MLSKVLLQQKSRARLFIAATGSLLGTLLLLTAIQLYFDITYLFTVKADDVISPSFLEVNKQVSMLNTLSVSSSSFSDEEIAEIRAQKFIRKVGVFTPTQFSMWLTGELSANLPKLQTDMFLEGLPDDMIDVQNNRWNWEPGQKEIPIIIPSYYLSLYNFAFAPSKGLPQITKGTVTRIPLTLEITDREGHRVYYKARVIDYSDRINTIMAPISFINWANKEYGREQEGKRPSRLLLEVDNPSNPRFAAFLEAKGYETSKDKLKGGKQMALLQVVLLVVGVVGVFIVILSVLVFVLTFQLLISRASEAIRLLIQLGHDYTTISRFFNRYFLRLFLGIQLIAFALVVLVKLLMYQLFTENALEVPAYPHWAMFLWGLLFTLAFSLSGVRAIHRTVRRLAD